MHLWAKLAGRRGINTKALITCIEASVRGCLFASFLAEPGEKRARIPSWRTRNCREWHSALICRDSLFRSERSSLSPTTQRQIKSSAASGEPPNPFSPVYFWKPGTQGPNLVKKKAGTWEPHYSPFSYSLFRFFFRFLFLSFFSYYNPHILLYFMPPSSNASSHPSNSPFFSFITSFADRLLPCDTILPWTCFC